MGVVSDFFTNYLLRQVEKKGLVVWYDPEGNYSSLVGETMGGIPVYRYEGSFILLRYLLEPLVSGNTPPKVIIYLPVKRRDNSPLIGLEKLGVVMEPGAPAGRNTRFSVIARNILKNRLSAENLESVIRKVEDGILGLKDLDDLAETGEFDVGTLSLIFPGQGPNTIALEFLTGKDVDDDIQQKEAVGDLIKFLKEFGFSTGAGRELAEIRRDWERYLLVTDFLASIPEEQRPPELNNVPHGHEHKACSEILNLVTEWRKRQDLRDSYLASSTRVEKELSLADQMDLPLEALKNTETFLAIERYLYLKVTEKLINEELTPYQALEIASSRMKGYWVKAQPLVRICWEFIITCSELMIQIENICKELEKTQDLVEMVRHYTGTTEIPGWYKLDQLHRWLETQSEALVDMTDWNSEMTENLVARAEQAYKKAFHVLSIAFVKLWAKEKYQIPQLIKQQQIFDHFVRPKLDCGKVAYFLVDALRYETGVELFSILGWVPERKISPACAAVPGITSVGMSALLPGAEKGFQLFQTDHDKLGVKLAGEELDPVSREERITYLLKKYPSAHAFHLAEVVVPKKAVKEKIKSADLVVVTSQEIDQLCESGNLSLAKATIQTTIQQLGRAVRSLYNLGVTEFIITADHGYFMAQMEDAMKVDLPSQTGVELHRRFWVGKGGKENSSCLRFRAQEVNYDSDLEFVFPVGLAFFKVKGGGDGYFHGGLSLQEMIVPIIELSLSIIRQVKSRAEGEKLRVIMDRKEITNRFFSVTIQSEQTPMMDIANVRPIIVAVKAGKKDIAKVVSAKYGFNATSQQIAFNPAEDNVVTLMLTEEEIKDEVSLHLLDAVTLVELDVIKGIKVDIIR
jgi:hypothetical protein